LRNFLKVTLLLLLARPFAGFGQHDTAEQLASLLAAAQKAQAASDYSTAATNYKQALRIRPEIPELWANLGLMQHESGDIAGAIQSFQRASRLNPSLYVPNLFLGIEYAHTGRAREAIPLLVRAEQINQADPQAPLALGRAYISVGRFSAAAEALGRATKLDPKLGAAWFTLGIALLDQVEADARRLSVEGKQSAFAGALFAESLQKQSRFGEAATLYKTLIDASQQPPCIRSDLGLSLLREHDEPGAAEQFEAERTAHPECGLALLGQARIAIDSGDTRKGLEILRELWDRDHGFVESNAAVLHEGLPTQKATALFELLSTQESSALPADLRNALLTALDASGQFTSNPTVRSVSESPNISSLPSDRRTAEEFFASGQFERCAHRIESAAHVLSAEKLRLLAACSFLTGNIERASSAAAALQTLQPDSLEALYWSIQANERLAYQSLARFQQLEPDSARSHVLLGDIYHQLERHDDAQAEYLKALAIAPGDPAAMLGLASAYLSNNNVQQAEKIARAALARSPEDPELNLILAEVKLSQNAFVEAETYLKLSLHAKPQMLPRVHALLGKAYAETGRTNEAVEELKLGASSDEDGSIQYLLARLYRKLGDSKSASEALARMKEIKTQRSGRGVKRVEDPDLSSLEYPPGGVPAT
jgi:tetratricopeptide (TPR) repeat protein